MENHDIPSKEQIEFRLKQGHSYAEAVDNDQRDTQEFNKYANFKLKTVMSNKNKELKDRSQRNKSSKELGPDDINMETFRWRVGNREIPLDEMDLDFKLTAYRHSLKHANKNHSKLTYHQQKVDIFERNTKYFVKLCDVLEESLMRDHNLKEAPSTVQHVKAMQEMIKNGTINTDNLVLESKSDLEDA